MFDRIMRFGGGPEDWTQQRAMAGVRQQLLQVVHAATGHPGGRWEGPDSKATVEARVDPKSLVPAAKRVLSAELARAADADKTTRVELVGAGMFNDVPRDDLNLYLLMVVGVVEAWLGRPSEPVREMASGTGFLVHEDLGRAHVANSRWAEAEAEFRSALEMARLAPDGREGVALMAVADMTRVQGREAEARLLFREGLQVVDRLDENAGSRDYAVHWAERVRSQLPPDWLS